MKGPLTTALFVFGYPTSIVVIARFVPVVRQRRTTWFAAHEAAVAAIVTGWALRGDAGAVAINGTWLVCSAVWYALGGRLHRADVPASQGPADTPRP